MSLSPDNEEAVRKMLAKVDLSGLEELGDKHTDHITDVMLLEGGLERLAYLPHDRFALLYGRLGGSVATVRVFPFGWATGSSVDDIDLATQAANDVLCTKGINDLKLVGLYLPDLEPEQFEGYLDSDLGLQVVMGGRMSIGVEGKRQFTARAISRNDSGNHFPVLTIGKA